MSKLFLLPAFALLALIGCGDKEDDTAELEEAEEVEEAEALDVSILDSELWCSDAPQSLQNASLPSCAALV